MEAVTYDSATAQRLVWKMCLPQRLGGRQETGEDELWEIEHSAADRSEQSKVTVDRPLYTVYRRGNWRPVRNGQTDPRQLDVDFKNATQLRPRRKDADNVDQLWEMRQRGEFPRRLAHGQGRAMAREEKRRERKEETASTTFMPASHVADT